MPSIKYPKFDFYLGVIKVKGPYFQKKENRYFVRVYFIDGKILYMTVARYLMCIKEKRILKTSECVDHKNENSVDDKEDNLQILSDADNKRKFWKNNPTFTPVKPGPTIICICKFCKKAFPKKLAEEQRRIKRKNTGPFCDRSCMQKYIRPRILYATV